MAISAGAGKIVSVEMKFGKFGSHPQFTQMNFRNRTRTISRQTSRLETGEARALMRPAR